MVRNSHIIVLATLSYVCALVTKGGWIKGKVSDNRRDHNQRWMIVVNISKVCCYIDSNLILLP
jgi:hypothetical protein